MKELIKNQISNEIFEKINLLEKEKNQEKTKDYSSRYNQ